ncbi:MAG: CsbD family protein [Rivularia sp. (in: Bacteria)]|nr:CsbD family protein [Rivularia sp. MS3]
MKSEKRRNKLHVAKHYCLSVFSCVLLLSTIWFGVWLDSAQAAIATSINEYPQQIIAANPLKGVGDKIEGNAEQAVGQAQRNLGKISGQTEGAAKEAEGLAKEAKGNVKQGIEKTKSAVEDASDSVEEGSENAIDAIKDFFGN